MEHEIQREPLNVTFHRLIELLRGYPIKLRELIIEHDLMISDGEDLLLHEEAVSKEEAT